MRGLVDVAFLALAPVSAAAFFITARVTREASARKLLYGAGVIVPLMFVAVALS